ncbi:hypothetical protein Prudu_008710 [Prunus dulcis]|uniref:Uncharacterized protein n=1 Tax=Prunus dulcis TaxID=3755 RepID=A0A4Y1R4M1_PRUDU|nr:hypothetical protein Prudu_008710 [Prunus dulcis]
MSAARLVQKTKRLCTPGAEGEASPRARHGKRSVLPSPLSIGDPSDLRGTFHNKLAERQGIYEPSGWNQIPFRRTFGRELGGLLFIPYINDQ